MFSPLYSLALSLEVHYLEVKVSCPTKMSRKRFGAEART